MKKRHCGNCANNQPRRYKRGCRALSRKKDGECWAWASEKMIRKQEVQIQEYFDMLGVRRT